MPKRFLGGAFSSGEHFNTCHGWSEEGDLPAGRFAKPIRNRWGKIVGYTEHKDRIDIETLPMESFGVAKAVALWNSRRMRLLRWSQWTFRKFEQWYAAKILWRRFR